MTKKPLTKAVPVTLPKPMLNLQMDIKLGCSGYASKDYIELTKRHRKGVQGSLSKARLNLMRDICKSHFEPTKRHLQTPC